MRARTLILPNAQTDDWTGFYWHDKDPNDMLIPYALDATAWLTDAGLTILGTPAVLATPGLLVTAPAVNGGVTTVLIGGGTANTEAEVAFTIPLSNGGQLNVQIFLPIRAGLPSDLITPGTALSRLIDDAGNLLADDFGGHLLAA